jgi:YVTN family beta-propeller protein
MINKQKLYSIALVSTALVLMLISITDAAPFAYITNSGSNNVSVIDTATNTVIATVSVESHPSGVGAWPAGVAVTPDGTKVYVANHMDPHPTVYVINTANNAVISHSACKRLSYRSFSQP